MTEIVNYINLHQHSEASLLDGLCRIEDLAKKLKELGQNACSITDHGNTFNHINAYQIFKKYGIKLIPGIEAYIRLDKVFKDEKRVGHYYFNEKLDNIKSYLSEKHVQFYNNNQYVRTYISEEELNLIKSHLSLSESSVTESRKRNHLTIIAKNREGLRNLNKLSIISNTTGFYHYPSLDIGDIVKHKDGLIILSGCMASPLSQMVIFNEEQFDGMLDIFRESFGDDFYLEIMYTGVPEQLKILYKFREVSIKQNIPIVATSDIHYVEKNDAFVQEVLLTINQHKKLSDPVVEYDEADGKTSRWRFSTNEYYIKSRDELKKFFTDEELDESLKISDKCDVNLDDEFGKRRLPKYPLIPNGKTSIEYLREICRKEWIIKQLNNYANKDIYVERIKYELDQIEKAELADYYLIIWDIIKFCDENSIPRGPSRGSSAGSIICWIINITEPDPIKYGLYFERFWNPGRAKSMPDIDIDIDINKRSEVIEHMRKVYGNDKVIQYVTFNTMQVKNAIRDVCKVFEYPDKNEIELICAAVPHKYQNLEDAIEQSPKLKEYSVKYNRIFDVVKRLENVKKSKSSHPSAYLISDKSIYDGDIPVVRDATQKTLLTGFNMYDMEALGYIKVDILGLKSVSVIQDIINTYNEK